jgi:flagellar biosynthesis/type III secretory pathway protein FliH
MFEKEAKERANKKYPIPFNWNEIHDTRRSKYEEGFKEGAEFGYNKCFEQIRKIVNEHTRLDCIIPELLRLQEIEDV